MPFSGLDRRGAGACGRGEGAGAPTGEHRALPQRDTSHGDGRVAHAVWRGEGVHKTGGKGNRKGWLTAGKK